MTRKQVLDQYFMDARHKLIDLAAFLDRVERAEGEADFRLEAFREAARKLGNEGTDRDCSGQGGLWRMAGGGC